jgi:hypothetical protein
MQPRWLLQCLQDAWIYIERAIHHKPNLFCEEVTDLIERVTKKARHKIEMFSQIARVLSLCD